MYFLPGGLGKCAILATTALWVPKVVEKRCSHEIRDESAATKAQHLEDNRAQ
jgi:hypothetical protein